MKPNTTVIVVATLFIAAGAYWFFFGNSSDVQPSLSASVTMSEGQAKFQALVNELQPIRFDTAIFTNKDFNSLVSITTAVSPEAQGRLDPFGELN